MPHSLDALFAKLSRSKPSPAAPVEYLVVGLGNPGKDYENTRHNVGFDAVDCLAGKYSCQLTRLKFKSLCGTAVIEGKQVLLMKPNTFMNLSGQAVSEAMRFYKIPIERVLVISDDISLDVGQTRIRRKGSAGGHNGLKNIIALAGGENFPRIKIGVGKKPSPDYDLVKWVLGHFSQEEQKLLAPAIENAAQAVPLILSGNMDEAMNRFNS